MGMSAGYHLAKRGLRTLLVDAFDPPHIMGSHHGEPRLIRHAYAGSSVYTTLALRAHELWNELEESSGEALLTPSGVLNMAPSEHFAADTRLTNSLVNRLPIELLDAEEIQRRWPGIVLPDHYKGLYEPTAGYLYSERCVAAYRKLAIAEGAELLMNTQVRQIEMDGDGVAVHTDEGIVRANKIILSVGAWFRTLEPFITLPIRPVRKVVGWFQAEEPLFKEGSFPGFTIGTSNGGYYGFPSISGAGVKIGRHDTGVAWNPGEVLQPFGHYVEDERDIRQVLGQFMPRAAGRLVRGVVCKYELTPDEDFIIDVHPEHTNVFIAAGFSGHGFKFASAIGELVSDWAVQGETKVDLSPFALSRFQ